MVKEEAKLVFDVLVNKDGRFYICGKISMAEAVNQAVIEVISKEGGYENQNADVKK